MFAGIAESAVWNFMVILVCAGYLVHLARKWLNKNPEVEQTTKDGLVSWIRRRLK